MTLEEFALSFDLVSMTELGKTKYIAFYRYEVLSQKKITLSQIIEDFRTLHYCQPNSSRLKMKIHNSQHFINGAGKDTFSLHARTIQQLRSDLPNIKIETDEIVFTGCILPTDLFQNTRGYIERISKQINASFEQHLYDGCAVLMRRLIEILLIHTYENNGIETAICNSDRTYKDLKFIIDDAQSNTVIGLSRDTKNCLGKFRLLGNFSAHKITYNCRKEDINNVALDYRVAVEELLYKSGIKV